MKIQIRAHDIKVTKALKAHVELRLGFALSRFGALIGRVSVHLSDSDEPGASREKRCRIAVGLPGCVKVQETDADVFMAVARAAEHAARSVGHALEQARTRAPGTSQPWKDTKPRPRGALLLEAMHNAGIQRADAVRRRRSLAPLRK